MAIRVHPRRKKPIRCLPRCNRFPRSLFLPGGIHVRLTEAGGRKLCRQWRRRQRLHR